MDLNFGGIDMKQEAGGKERLYFVIILVLIFVSFARWFYVPKMSQIKTLKVEVKNNSMQLDTLKQFAQLKLPEFQPALQSTRQARGGTKFEKAVESSMHSPQQVTAEIVRQMTNSNMLNGIRLNGMTFGSEINKGLYGAIPISIDIEGKYSGIISYLNQMEHFGRLIIADNVELATEEKEPGLIKAKISASIYVVYREGSAPPPPSEPAQGDASGVVKGK